MTFNIFPPQLTDSRDGSSSQYFAEEVFDLRRAIRTVIVARRLIVFTGKFIFNLFFSFFIENVAEVRNPAISTQKYTFYA